jgi:tRNA/rRNA methyltransferase
MLADRQVWAYKPAMTEKPVHNPAGDEPLQKPPEAPAIILVEPQLGDNIGAAARAMANFGLGELRLVSPRDGWPSARARSFAANAEPVIDNALLFQSVEDAIADLHFVMATTARPRGMIKPVASPQTAMAETLARTNARQNCGVLFGKESSGLTNDHVALADWVVIAPVHPAYASINLAQAVLLVGYEWRKQSKDVRLGRQTAFDGPASEGIPEFAAQPAAQSDLIGLFEDLEHELDASGFLRPPEKRGAVVRNIRNMIKRMNPTDQDVRTLRGIVASLTRRHERLRGGGQKQS